MVGASHDCADINPARRAEENSARRIVNPKEVEGDLVPTFA